MSQARTHSPPDRGFGTKRHTRLCVLPGHLARAKENGLTEAELKEVMIHLAFYAGWPRALSAITVAKEVFST
jgi:alkylhydroperoxidase/carboxymuconolactone decarboxylase family protein YurZ